MADWNLLGGDCRTVLATLDENSVDAIITDSPYGLSEQPDIVAVLTAWLADERYEASGGGFMGKKWDAFVPGPDVWRECFRVLKPGGHLLAFASTRTYDLLSIAVRLARFDVRDMLSWLYGSGFPKSLDVSKAIGRDPVSGREEAWDGWGTALKPACEPIVLARKPLIGTVAANVQAYGTGALNIDACRIATDENPSAARRAGKAPEREGGTWANDRRSPEGFAAARAGEALGRWPANVLLDEEAAQLLDEQTGNLQSHGGGSSFGVGYHGGSSEVRRHPRGDSGGASRFFYVAKASRREREGGCEHLPTKSGAEATDSREGAARLNSPRTGAGRGGGARNHHPTVKPIEVMRWLIRLVTPPGGLVLDPFVGSGTTGIAALREGHALHRHRPRARIRAHCHCSYRG